jgi:ornithine carbamoyltransferase
MYSLNTKSFLTGEELTQMELSDLLDSATQMKVHKYQDVLNKKTVALLFEKSSMRTRMSFSVGIDQLGGKCLELNSSVAKKESPADTIRVLQGYVDGLMVRTHSHENLQQMLAVAKIPLINGLSDLHHPCQAIADLLTLKERFGKLESLTLAYIGDGNNVLHSLLLLLPVLGVNVRYACPPGYKPNAKILKRAHTRALLGGAQIIEVSTPEQAVKDVNAIYTDVWTSMGQEEETAARVKAFASYQINAKLFALAHKDAAIMHCMPINEGQEITREMIEHKNSVLFQQSENRLHAQKALMMGLFATAQAVGENSGAEAIA